MNQRLTYGDRCRAAATAQGLDPITERLTAEGISYDVEQTGGFVMVVRIPLTDPAWIGVTASNKQGSAWCVVLYNDDIDEGTPLPTAGSYDLAADEAVPAIHEHLALARPDPAGPPTPQRNVCASRPIAQTRGCQRGLAQPRTARQLSQHLDSLRGSGPPDLGM